MTKHLVDRPALPTRWKGNAPAGLNAVLEEGLALDPDDRIQSAGDLLARLEKLSAPKPKPAPKPPKPKLEAQNVKSQTPKWLWGALAIAAAVIIMLAMALLNRPATATPAPPAPIPTPNPTPPNMVFVPAGEFTMGSNNGGSDEQPVHTVYLDSFYIDKYEVTNAQFAQFLNAKGNQSEGGTSWFYAGDRDAKIHQSGSTWQADVGYEKHPVISVTWYGAQAYCEWQSKSLPTEAQWEKAARGTDGRTYPWGEGIDCDKAQYGDCGGETVSVGTKNGVSPYGAYDMAGNVWEWVNDWYDGNYYAGSPASNPTGPSSGQTRVVRGGGWYAIWYGTRVADRYYSVPYYRSNYIGCRCAVSPGQ